VGGIYVKLPKKFQIGILVFVICCVLAVSGCITINTGSSNTSSNTSSSSNTSANTSTSNDVVAVINYSGSWSGVISGPFVSRNVEGTGDQSFNLGNVSGYITVSATKKDSGGTLTVSIEKGGKTLGSQSTSYAYAGTSITTNV
jgi:hypothetical protein